jgi:hypothetical protein
MKMKDGRYVSYRHVTRYPYYGPYISGLELGYKSQPLCYPYLYYIAIIL